MGRCSLRVLALIAAGTAVVGACGDDDSGGRPTWRQLESAGPRARGYHLMTYDPTRERVLVVGGYRGDWTDEMWEWDGAAWTELPRTGNPMPNRNAIAFDTARGRAIEVGDHGLNRTRPTAYQTWEWGSSAWTHIGDAPSAAEDTAIAYDAARGQVVMFGGYNNMLDGATRIWDGQAWIDLAVEGPDARRYHAMAYDAARERVVLFGGTTTSGFRGDTWEWDGARWEQVATTGPQARNRHAMVYVPGRNRVVLHGGDGNADTWEWDGASWRELTGPGPRARDAVSMAYDQARGQLVLFGGMLSFGTGILDDLWVLDL